MNGNLRRDDFAFDIVERNALAGLNRRNRHAQRDRMVVSRVNVGIRLLIARLHAFHPVAHVGAGLRV